MTPDFALSLSFDGIRLSHRTPDGWSPVGEVPLDSPDLAGAMAGLRRAGLDLGRPWTGTKIVLPNEQVRYLTLDDPDAGPAEVRAALDGVTPYPVEALVIDHVSDGARTYVAAVARETLDEAEAFAAEHGFQPISFAAEPPGALYKGEASFGPTTLAASITGAEAVPPRDQTSQEQAEPQAAAAVAESEPETPAPPVAEPTPPVPPATAQEPASESPVAEPARAEEVAASEPDPEVRPVEPAPAPVAPEPEASEPKVPEVIASAAPDPSPAPESLSVDAAPDDVPPPVAEPAVEMSVPAAPLSATGVPEPIFASRARPLRGPTRDGVTVEPRPIAARQADTARREPKLAAAPRQTAGQAPVLAASRTEVRVPPKVTPPSPQLRREPSVAAVLPAAPATPVMPAAAPVLAGAAVVAPAPAPATAPAPEPARAIRATSAPAARRETQPRPDPTTEAARMTVFGARPATESGRVGGKPRFLALILTAILLILMGAVALMASVTDRSVAELLGFDATPATEVAVASVAAPPSADVDPTTPKAVAEPVTPAPAEAVPPEPAAAADPADASAEAPRPDASAAAAAAVAQAIAALPKPEAPASGAPVSADEADRVYAATGVWLRAPRLPVMPSPEGSATPGLAVSADKAPQGDTPVLVSLQPDAPIAAPVNPPPPGTRTPLDARGRVLASPDGVLTPAGVRVVAGSPEIVPPTRPGSRAPVPAPVESEAPADSEAPVGSESSAEDNSGWVNAMAAPPGKVPHLRPEGLVPEDAPADAAAAEATAEETAPAGADVPVPPGGVALAGLRPESRPQDLAPEVAAPETPEEVVAFDGPRPAQRPEGLAPERRDAPEPPVGPDVTDAIAQALSEPASQEQVAEAPPPPAAPAAPDLQSTLANIVQGAPDPLAGATARAVASARVPDTRPNGFGRVVQDQMSRTSRAAQEQPRQQQQATARQGGAGGVGTGRLQPNEAAESSEAEVASAAAAVPSGPTASSVAQAATFADAMALRDINLIGVYGQPDARRALVRMGNGRYLRVGVGDSLDGGQVTAIGDNVLNYVRRGQTQVLVIPGG
ncbi:hypothetical protein [Rubellimicrobium arenae]|uniref:hypothetical protein n=1 Tax=Rubellimicrobium arenae TaxID=2817372 RepID=UPI001B30D1E1|nr:hypothetical protein [Rubellimicrobium arenae]